MLNVEEISKMIGLIIKKKDVQTDICPAANREDHGIQRREIYVGTCCNKHAKAKTSTGKSEIVGSRPMDSGYETDSFGYGSSDYDRSDTGNSGHAIHRSNNFTDAIGESQLRVQVLEKIVNAENADEQFIPAGDIHAVLTADSVKQELRRYNMEQLLPKVFNQAKRLFAILLVIGRLDALRRIIKAGLSDADLPLTMYGYLEKRQPYSDFFSSFVEWNIKAHEQFVGTQWTFLAPTFKDGEHQKLEDSARLPFTDTKVLGSGSYGEVSRVTIHGDHYQFEMPKAQPATKGGTFALKRFTQDSEGVNLRIFKNELAIMKSLQSLDINRITKVLASFEHKGNYFMILPLAEENLRQFWAHSQPASFTSEWCLKEMAGISSGLSVLHQAAGWHLDLKPENILVFRDGRPDKLSFRISDFGISYVHPKGSKLELPPHPGTGTYEPPECQMNQKQSQKSDLWSLGCIFLEVLVWSLKGSDAIGTFADDRLRDTPASDGNFRNDYYFSLEVNREFTPLGVRTRPAVLRWIESLDRDPNCGPATSEALRLLRDSLLQVEQSRRLEAGQVSERLVRFAHMGVKEYFLSGSSVPQRSPEGVVTELGE